ncbi:ABC transporter substrate-binding protein [Acrocarpospora phusangensis]|uniref:ABC transporter substrate-binding protein n=1 Tax=Acrocarpospora phusangensis TaxID=1070424 RepID=A0A919QD40_9ACTN|nr:ABC transporter substrate-binding protein [Acrocarpospora phusangensis]GIH24370.1 ABC transporter substrate-binding protein [Acrocarpospora phusangensis]
MSTYPTSTYPTRRTFLGALGTAAVAGCSSGLRESSGGTGRSLKIGYVSPRTGPLAVFGESDDYVLGRVRAALAKGLSIGGRGYPVEIVVKDTQSSAARAAEVAGELIQRDRVDIVLATSTPDTTNPVSDQCEAARVPCVATVCPWEIWAAGRPAPTYSYLHFIGTEQEVGVFAGLWSKADTNKVVGGLWPNDTDGELYRRFVTAEPGWRVSDPGAYEDGTQDYTSILAAFARDDVEILQAAPIPPDWVTFWRQAAQHGFRPKIVSVAKAMLFPTVAKTLGELAEGLVAPVWWSAAFPYRSSLDGTTAKAFADGYGRPWTPPMGFNHALFEIAVAAFRAAADPKDHAAVAAAIGTLKGEAISGRYDFTAGPSKNVSMAPDLLGQWRRNPAGEYDLVIVDNTLDPAIPLQGEFTPLR